MKLAVNDFVCKMKMTKLYRGQLNLIVLSRTRTVHPETPGVVCLALK